MPSGAISSKDTIIRVGTADGSPKTIISASKANPCVIGATAHGFANGTVVYIDNAGGMVELNGRAFVIANVAANTFQLLGVDSTGYTTWTSGGTATAKTMTEIADITAYSLFNGTTPEIRVTNLRSRRQEYILDIPDTGDGSLTTNHVTTDPGQARLKYLQSNPTVKEAFTAALQDGKMAAFVAFVQGMPVSGGVGQAVGGQIALRITGEEAWFA